MECLNNNPHAVETLPYDILKTIFPSVRYIVNGEKWHFIAISKHKNKWTGKEEGKPIGRFMEDLNGKTFDNPTQAADWAKRNYTKGHWKVKAYIPELHQVPCTNKIMSDR